MTSTPFFGRSGRPALLLVLAILSLFVTVSATEVPYLGGRVNDIAEILSAETVRSLEEVLKHHEDSTSNQIVVLTITSLEGEPLEEYSRRVVMTWKLGEKEKDNGVLLFVAKDDRKVRIEVGRGLEGNLTDAVASSIMRNEILPQFKAGDYDAGVRAGVDAIINAIAGAYTADESDESAMDFGTGMLVFLFFLFVVGIFTLIAFATQGCGGWFLYAFLLPFWGVFPSASLGPTIGLPLFGLYAIGLPLAKIFFPKTAWGKKIIRKIGPIGGSGSGGRSGWSSSGGSSSSGSSYSGGGGSFSGGGSSGSW